MANEVEIAVSSNSSHTLYGEIFIWIENEMYIHCICTCNFFPLPRVEEFSRNSVPSGELQIYTWYVTSV